MYIILHNHWTILHAQYSHTSFFLVGAPQCGQFGGKFSSFLDLTDCNFAIIVQKSDLFENWHNDRYLAQCYYNLQEKFDCGGIEAADWNIIYKFYWDYQSGVREQKKGGK